MGVCPVSADPAWGIQAPSSAGVGAFRTGVGMSLIHWVCERGNGAVGCNRAQLQREVGPRGRTSALWHGAASCPRASARARAGQDERCAASPARGRGGTAFRGQRRGPHRHHADFFSISVQRSGFPPAVGHGSLIFEVPCT